MALDISRIRALCFDVDGTLRDTDDYYVQKLTELLKNVRLLFPQNDPKPFARRVVMASEDLGAFLHGIPDRLGIDDELADLANRLDLPGSGGDSSSFMLVDGVIEMLNQLYQHYPIAVVSARGRRGTKAFLDYYGLTPFFRAIVTAQSCEHTKPYPDPVIWAADQMHVPTTACLMIGDTTVDIRAGKAAGAQTVGVLCGFGEENELRESGADLILSKTSEITQILLGRSGTPNFQQFS